MSIYINIPQGCNGYSTMHIENIFASASFKIDIFERKLFKYTYIHTD